MVARLVETLEPRDIIVAVASVLVGHDGWGLPLPLMNDGAFFIAWCTLVDKVY